MTATSDEAALVVLEAEDALVGEVLPPEGSDPVDLGVDPDGRSFGVRDAQRITQLLRQSEARTWMLVAIAHDRKAPRALGYDRWEDYVKAELPGMSVSRSYQHIQTGRVMLVLAQAAGVDPALLEPIPTRQVTKILQAGVLPALKTTVSDLVQGHHPMPPALAIAEAVDRLIPRPPRTLRQPPHEAAVGETTEACPVCDGRGHLGSGGLAQELAKAARKWRSDWFRRRAKTSSDEAGTPVD